MNVVALSLAQPRVGGSVACASAIAEGHDSIGRMLKDGPSRRILESMFNICGTTPLENAKNQALWAGQGVLPLDIQSNDPACEGELCNIGKVCSFVTNASRHGVNALETLAKLSKSLYGDGCIDVSFDDYEAQLTNTTLSGGGGRVWFYQTCMEFGFYQTCEEDSACPYTKGLNTLDFNLEQCRKAFGLSPEQVKANIEATNDFYGALDPKSTRVLFPSGQVDPWHSSSLLVSPGPELPTLWVPGASHHFWTHPSASSDAPEIVRAREAIWGYVSSWLGTSAVAESVPLVV